MPWGRHQGVPCQVQPGGYPARGVPCRGVPCQGVPCWGLPCQGGTQPMGGTLPGGYPPRGGTQVGQQKEYSIHSGQYASCVQAGGLSWFCMIFGYTLTKRPYFLQYIKMARPIMVFVKNPQQKGYPQSSFYGKKNEKINFTLYQIQGSRN